MAEGNQPSIDPPPPPVYYRPTPIKTPSADYKVQNLRLEQPDKKSGSAPRHLGTRIHICDKEQRVSIHRATVLLYPRTPPPPHSSTVSHKVSIVNIDGIHVYDPAVSHACVLLLCPVFVTNVASPHSFKLPILRHQHRPAAAPYESGSFFLSWGGGGGGGGGGCIWHWPQTNSGG